MWGLISRILLVKAMVCRGKGEERCDPKGDVESKWQTLSRKPIKVSESLSISHVTVQPKKKHVVRTLPVSLKRIEKSRVPVVC